MTNCWTDVEGEIGMAEVVLGKDILVTNIENEKSLSEKPTCIPS
jgi:hypothetical protein